MKKETEAAITMGAEPYANRDFFRSLTESTGRCALSVKTVISLASHIAQEPMHNSCNWKILEKVLEKVKT